MNKLIVLTLVLAMLLGACSCTIGEACSMASPADPAPPANSPLTSLAEDEAFDHKELLSFSSVAEEGLPLSEPSLPATDDLPVTEAEAVTEAATEAVTEAVTEKNSETATSAVVEITTEPTSETTPPTADGQAVALIGPTASDGTQTTPADTVGSPKDPADPSLADTDVPAFSMEERVFAFAIDCVESDLRRAGYDVFVGYANVDGTPVQGLIFTNYTLYSNGPKDTYIYEAGFIQFESQTAPSKIRVTSETVSKGLFAIDGVYSEDVYLITYAADIRSWSGLVEDRYFCYEQTEPYIISVCVREDQPSSYREDVDLYDYNKKSYVFKGDLSFHSVSATGFYGSEERYQYAVQTLNAVATLQDSKGYEAKQLTLILFSSDAINEYCLNGQQGTLNGYSLEELANIPLAPDQFLIMTDEGPKIFTTPPSNDELATQRTLRGIMTIVGGAVVILAVGMSIASMGSATPAAVAAVAYVSGTVATMYAASNIIYGIQETVLGIQGDIETPSINPLLDCLKDAMEDDELATKLYHGIGGTATWVTTMCVPVAGVYNSSALLTSSVSSAIVRAVGVELVKDATIGLVAAGAGSLTKYLTHEITGSEAWAEFAGFSTALVAGAFAAKKAGQLDQRHNFSGTQKRPSPTGGDTSLKNYEASSSSKDTTSVKEGDVGSYQELRSRIKKYKQDLIKQLEDPSLDPSQASVLRANLEEAKTWQVHHVPAQGRFGIDADNGIGIVIPHSYHKQTFTYGHTKDPYVAANHGYNNTYYNTLSPNQALDLDLSNLRAILKAEGVYPQFEASLVALEKAIYSAFPNIFSS